MRFLLLLLSFSFFHATASAFPDSVGTRKHQGKTFIIHEIEEAEGWFSIARRYNITYTELRLANKDSADKLIPGRTLLIPVAQLKANDPFFGKNELLYEVKEGETLFSIAKKFNTSIDSLKKWNKLSEDLLKPRQQLMIRSSLVTPKTGKPEPVPAKTDIARKETTVAKSGKPASGENTSKVDSTKIVKTATVAAAKKPVKKSGKVVPPERKEITESGIASWIRDDDVNPNKYYALHRTAPIGTIIKVMNKMNNRYVFVKVVGLLPDTGDNADLVIKISKASAEKLGVFDSRFQCLLTYSILENR